MELLNISLNKYTLACPKCYELAIFYILPYERNIKSECINGHKYNNISYNSFIGCCIRKNWSSNKTCKICKIKISEFKDNYICKNCGYIFCDLCIENHFKLSNHNNKIKYINYSSICKLHNKDYKYYCKICNSNICGKCKKIHKDHSIKSYKSIIKFIKTEINNFATTVEEHKKKIDYNLHKYNTFHINKYLHLLDGINEYYLKDFNFEFFNYYHFQNFKYFYKFVTNQINSINSIIFSYEYINFLHFRDIEELPTKEFQDNKYLLYNNDNNFACYNNNLIFIFYSHYLKLFEIKNYNLNFILLNYFDSAIRIHRPMQKPNGYIFVDNKNIIKIFQYDENNKTLILKYNIFIGSNEINDILDLKNGDIVVNTNEDLKIIKEKKEIKNFHGQYKLHTLYQLNDSMFISAKNSEITFFDTVNYKIIKEVNLFRDIKTIEVNDKFIMAITKFGELYIVNIKYLEIVQKIEGLGISNGLLKLFTNHYYIISNDKIKKYNVNNGKLVAYFDYYKNYTFHRINTDKNHKKYMFLIGGNDIIKMDLS